MATGDEKTALGILVWDVTSVPAGFADENADNDWNITLIDILYEKKIPIMVTANF